MRVIRFSALALLAFFLLFAGCTQEQGTGPTKHVIPGKGNPDCQVGGVGKDDCAIDTQKIAGETGPAHHCQQFDEKTAIIIADDQPVDPGNGRFHGIHMTGTTPTQTFDITITACKTGLPPNPFHNMPGTGMHEWNSGSVVKDVPYGAWYEMQVTTHDSPAPGKASKGGGTKPQTFDPHIVFGG